MTVRTVPLKDGGVRYLVQEDRDFGKVDTVAYFDNDFQKAGIVLRYLKGSVMCTSDQKAALRAMQEYDQRKRMVKEDVVPE